jgi:hypothetical protein
MKKDNLVMWIGFIGIPLFLVVALILWSMSKILGTKPSFGNEGFAGLSAAIGLAFYCGLVEIIMVIVAIVGVLIR